MTIKTINDFNKRLNTFQRQSKNSQTSVWECAKFAMKHVENCGDLGPMQRVHDAMPKGYANRGGLVRWAMSFAPINFEGGKFTKDKSEDALEYDLEEAFKQPFWESFPIPEKTEYFDVSDIQKALDSIVKRFNRDNKRTVDPKATKALKTLETLKIS